MNLQDFLCQNPVDNLTDTFYPGVRFKEAGLPFTIRAMSSQEFDDITKRCTKVTRSKGQEMRQLDNSRFFEDIAISFTVEPNFKDAEAVKKAGCRTPEDYLNRSLKPGELAYLVDAIQQLSGFDRSVADLKDEVKNG